MILPDGTLYKKQGGWYIVNNTLENRHKVLDTYPEWAFDRNSTLIKMRPFAAMEVFK